MTGGDVVKPGAIDVGPGTIRYLWNYATGGLGATVSRLIDLAKKDEIGPNDIPIVRRFQSRVDPRQIVFDYRKNIKDPLRYYDLYRHATPDQRRRIMAEHKDMIRLGMRAHATEKIMRRLYKQEKAARIRGDRAAVRRIEEAVKARAASYNRAYYEQTR
ncbi:hypothetical protein D6779_07245 [Candidatus Parcubacteria bacterium]|nr:MAG: hypothetical protein D6779_07245 [Candidatus Parcubacteria bacterium]